MAMDTLLLLVALLSFAALVATWIAAPLNSDGPSATAAEPAGNTVTA